MKLKEYMEEALHAEDKILQRDREYKDAFKSTGVSWEAWLFYTDSNWKKFTLKDGSVVVLGSVYNTEIGELIFPLHINLQDEGVTRVNVHGCHRYVNLISDEYHKELVQMIKNL